MEISTTNIKKIVVFDFDGVINSYSSGWCGIDNIPDPPVLGIKEAIDKIRKADYYVVVVSSRCATETGIEAIKDYLYKYDIEVDSVQMEKPLCVATIDDRAICFDGNPKNLLQQIDCFEPWWRKKSLYHKCILFDKECIYIDDYIDIEDKSKYPLHVYYIMMDSDNNPNIIGTGVYPGYNVYGTVLSRYDFVDHHNNVTNGDYFMPIPQDFSIAIDRIDVEEYIEGC